LLSALNQHPAIHATTTSPLVDLIEIIIGEWQKISGAIIGKDRPKITNMIGGLIHGAYKHIDKSTVVDKNRLWPRHAKLMHEILGHKPKIICTVRPIPEILSSFILLIEKNKDRVTYVDRDLIAMNLPINNKNRCRVLWEKYLLHPYTSLRLAFSSNDVDLCVVTYDDIVNDTHTTLSRICQFIGVSTCTFDTGNLQSMDENDDFYGGLNGLHQVRSVIGRTSPPPEEVIGHYLVDYYCNMKLDFWKNDTTTVPA
jgi:hypothetical protein